MNSSGSKVLEMTSAPNNILPKGLEGNEAMRPFGGYDICSLSIQQQRLDRKALDRIIAEESFSNLFLDGEGSIHDISFRRDFPKKIEYGPPKKNIWAWYEPEYEPRKTKFDALYMSDLVEQPKALVEGPSSDDTTEKVSSDNFRKNDKSFQDEIAADDISIGRRDNAFDKTDIPECSKKRKEPSCSQFINFDDADLPRCNAQRKIEDKFGCVLKQSLNDETAPLNMHEGIRIDQTRNKKRQKIHCDWSDSSDEDDSYEPIKRVSIFSNAFYARARDEY